MSPLKEISSKQKKDVVSQIRAPGLSQSVLKKNVQFISYNEDKNMQFLYDSDRQLNFFEFQGQFLPTIQFIRKHETLKFPEVHVDQGAVKHILNGADIYTQGITSVIGEFDKQEFVLIKNPQKAVLALGQAMFSSQELTSVKGKGIRNLHHLGDFIWDQKV
ncbi:MAG: PUA domain-containing protein [Candidatus Hodarchaeales archaeon]